MRHGSGTGGGNPRERGIALIAVLWIVVLISLMAASFLSQTSTETRLSAHLAEAARLEAAADGAVYLVIWAALNGMTPEQANLVPYTVEAGDALQRTRHYATEIGNTPVAVTIEVEGEKIDLNEADEEGLINLLRALGLQQYHARQLAHRILDFRDPDLEARLLGAEDPDYQAVDRPWGAKDAPFQALEELQQVLGVTPEIYAMMQPYVSVTSGGRGIAGQLLTTMAEANGGWAPGEASADDPDEPDEQDTVAESAIMPAGRLIYSIRAAAMNETGGRFRRDAVVRLTGRRNGYQILDWREGIFARVQPDTREPH